MIPLALMAVGTALQIYGQYSANQAQSEQERQNAEFYDEQAKFAREAMFRQSAIASQEYEFRKGAQFSAYAKGGVDISGSAAVVLADTLANKVEELTAIKRKGGMEVKLAHMRANQSRDQADTLSSFEYNFTQGMGSLLTYGAKAYDNGKSPALSTKSTKVGDNWKDANTQPVMRFK